MQIVDRLILKMGGLAIKRDKPAGRGIRYTDVGFGKFPAESILGFYIIYVIIYQSNYLSKGKAWYDIWRDR